jgi:chemotaxis response regulator CheB
MLIDMDVPADRPPGDEAASRRQRVVALGASAGGAEALT